MAELMQRAASLSDLKEIWGLMRQAAPEIPFDLESETAQESMLTEIMACCTSDFSSVAVGEDKAIVGVVLARRDDFEWGFRNGKALHMSYAAIAPSHRDRGLLPALVAKIQERKVPVFASVREGNKLGLADELQKLGFASECTAANGWGELYKWQPPTNGAAPAR